MRIKLIHLLLTISAILDDIAFYVLGKQEEDTGFKVKTKRCEHLY